MKIVVAGTPASGKSSVAKALAEALGFSHYSVGDRQRELANQMGIDIVALGHEEAKSDRIDREMDRWQAELGRTQDGFVIDSWLGARFVPDAFKVYIDADINVRARRRQQQKRPEDREHSLRLIRQKMKEREETNLQRWRRYYGFDYSDKGHYDLVLDSSRAPIGSLVAEIVAQIKKQNLNSSRLSDRKTASLGGFRR